MSAAPPPEFGDLAPSTAGPEGSEGPDGEELFGPGRERRPRRDDGPLVALRDRAQAVPRPVWLGLGLLVLISLVAGQLLGTGRSAPKAATTIPTAATAPSETTATTPATPAVSASTEALDALIALAASSAPIPDYVRSSETMPTCPAVAPDLDPAGSVTRAISARLPGFTRVTTDSAMTLNADSTLCTLIVRAVSTTGSGRAVAIVRVSAPTRPVAAAFQAQRHLGADSARDVSTVQAGWAVEVGWTGPTDRPISYTQLSTLAGDPSLRW